MAVLGLGVDLTEVDRIAHLRETYAERFLERCFTEHEREVCLSAKRADERFAARFAAKEAVLKALGTGWTRGIGWTDVEVVTEPSGQPTVRVTGRAAAIAAERGIVSWHLSLSHASGFAVASAVAESA